MHDGRPSGRARFRDLCRIVTFRQGKRPIPRDRRLLHHQARPSRLATNPQRIIFSPIRLFAPEVRIRSQIKYTPAVQVDVRVLEWIVDRARHKIEAGN
jgi:hypothetical protein